MKVSGPFSIVAASVLCACSAASLRLPAEFSRPAPPYRLGIHPEDPAITPVFIEAMAPRFPQDTTRGGDAQLEILVGTNGTVSAVRMQTDTAYEWASFTAIRHWRFAPRPQAWTANVGFSFRIPERIPPIDGRLEGLLLVSPMAPSVRDRVAVELHDWLIAQRDLPDATSRGRAAIDTALSQLSSWRRYMDDGDAAEEPALPANLHDLSDSEAPPPTSFSPRVHYPNSAVVRVEVVVDEKGVVRAVRVIDTTDPDADRAVLATISLWRFEPLRIDGRPTAFRYRLSLRVQGFSVARWDEFPLSLPPDLGGSDPFSVEVSEPRP